MKRTAQQYRNIAIACRACIDKETEINEALNQIHDECNRVASIGGGVCMWNFMDGVTDHIIIEAVEQHLSDIGFTYTPKPETDFTPAAIVWII